MTKLRPNSFPMSRPVRIAALGRAAVLDPCDVISSLKNHCTPAACSAEPPSLSIRLIWLAILAGVGLRWPPTGWGERKSTPAILFRWNGVRRLHRFVVNPQRRCSGRADGSHSPPDALRLLRDLPEVVDEHAAEPAPDERTDSDGQKRKAHICALLTRRREAGNIFVVARLLRDLAERENNQGKNRHENGGTHGQNHTGHSRNQGS